MSWEGELCIEMGTIVKLPTANEVKPSISKELLDLRTWKLLGAIEELREMTERNTRHINFLIKEIGKLKNVS